MFEVLPETDPHLLAIRVGGKLTRQDYARLNPWLDEQLARHPRPAMLVDMRRFEGFEGPGALLDDMRSGVKHWGMSAGSPSLPTIPGSPGWSP